MGPVIREIGIAPVIEENKHEKQRIPLELGPPPSLRRPARGGDSGCSLLLDDCLASPPCSD
jgi:hypothetical protein